MKKILSMVALSAVTVLSSAPAQSATVDLSVGPLVYGGVYTEVGGLFNSLEVELDILQEPDWVDLTFTTSILDPISGLASAGATVVLGGDLSFGFYDDNGLIDEIDLITHADVSALGIPVANLDVNNISANLDLLNNTHDQSLTISKSDVTGDLKGVFTFDSAVLGVAVTTYSFASAVPEPSTYALMLGGLGLVGFMAARRKKQA